MKRWGDEQGSGVVPTAWSLLALIAASEEEESSFTSSMEKAALYLVKRQLSNGDWPQEGIAGVFNRACTFSQLISNLIFFF
eukprot:GSMAST32.ASY1.ANO1.646.1 assembled CDS